MPALRKEEGRERATSRNRFELPLRDRTRSKIPLLASAKNWWRRRLELGVLAVNCFRGLPFVAQGKQVQPAPGARREWRKLTWPQMDADERGLKLREWTAKIFFW